MRVVCAVVALLAATATPAQTYRHSGHVKASAAARKLELRGRWQVGPLIDPAHHPQPTDFAAQLAAARLPAPGEVLRGTPGNFCGASIDCNEVSWTETSLASYPGGDTLKQRFGLPADTRVYEGDTGNRWHSYTVLARPDRTLAAVIGLCRDFSHAVDCYDVLEIWRPISPDAKMMVVSARR